jgi:predicted secreted protein
MKAVLVVVALALVAGQRVVGLKETGDEEATCQAGEKVAFRIASNPSTGYSWFLVPSDSVTASLLSGNEGTYIPGESMPGAPGEQEFLLKCHEQANIGDTYPFSLIKRRPWEDHSIRSKAVTLTVVA